MTDLQPAPPRTATGRNGSSKAPGGRTAGLGAWARWVWRTLTSMRTALVLLALLALAAVPGSLLPQLGVSSDPGQVTRFRADHPTVAPWLDRLGLFEVYSAPWFAAIYLLLLTSTTGCVLPRCLRLWRAARSAPPRAPTRLARLPQHASWVTDRPAGEALPAAATELRRRGFRVRLETEEVRAGKGYLREGGNLAFHLSLLVLLFGVAGGKLYGFEGMVIVAEGAGFSNTRAQYDSFFPGPLFADDDFEPFTLSLTDFDATFETAGPQRGSPRGFTADVEVTEADGRTRPARIEVNHPVDVDGTKVFLTGHGYAPRFTVRDGNGRTVLSGPVVFLPRDGNFSSEGVVKAPDAQPTQLGFEGFFLPTAAVGPQGPVSQFPDLLNPQVFLTAYTGDLSLGNGFPQSVYVLDKSSLTQPTVDGQPLAQALAVGDTMTLPDGQGSITFDGVARFANFQIARDPGKEVALVAALLLLAGLTVSLTVRQRRVWVRAHPLTGPGTVGCRLEAATLPLTRRGAPDRELPELARALGAGPPAERGSADADLGQDRTHQKVTS